MYWHMRCQTIQTGKASVTHLGFKVETFHGVKKVLVGIKRAIIVSMGKSLFPTIHLLFRFDLLKGIAQKQRSSRMERVKKCKTNLARVRQWTWVGLSEQIVSCFKIQNWNNDLIWIKIRWVISHDSFVGDAWALQLKWTPGHNIHT